jgi:dihydrofolate reductase
LSFSNLIRVNLCNPWQKLIFVSMISIIVAASENNAIGREGELLWTLPNDMKFFKNTTWGLPAIMGRKTYESLGKPLPGRINIVITRQDGWHAVGVMVAKDITEALQKAAEANCKEIFIIGGGEIYKQSMDVTDRIYLTRVHHTFKDADAFFPAIDENIWELKSNEDFDFDGKHAYAYSFQVWEKK